jgi:DNA-binding MarR family transcriptional regulator
MNMDMDSQQVCQDLLSLLARVKATFAHLAEVYSLTSMQMYALYSIYEGSTTMGNVAEFLHCDASNVTGIVDRLVAQKLISREECAQDRRAKVLTLTSKGHDLMQNVMAGLPAQMGCAKLNNIEGMALHDIALKLAV